MKGYIVITIFICFSSVSLSGQNSSNLYSFFIAGHTYGKPGVNNIGLHPPFKEKFGYIQSRPEIKFGIFTGDIVSGSPLAQDWDEVDADVDTLGIPVHFAVGNHDMENRQLFEDRYGTTYYSFIYQNDLFIVLDPNIDGWNITGTQLQFLEDVVNDNYSTTDNIYVFFHQILWREDNNQFNYIKWNSSEGRGATVNFWTAVEPIFHNLPNKTIMFSGDLGASWSSNVTYDQCNNITLIASGMGDVVGENFIIVNVDSNKSINYDLVCLSDTNYSCLGELADYQMVSCADENPLDQPIIYPNPAPNYFILELHSNTLTTVQLYNMQGRFIKEEQCNNYKTIITVSDVAKGMYFVKISSALNRSTVKLLIE